MNPSPLQNRHEQNDVAFLPFGDKVQLVIDFDAIELEYAALRKYATLMDRPDHALLQLSGKDRLDFLHRLLTGDCNTLQPGQTRRMLMLNAKGRIMADMIVIHEDVYTWLELDVYSAAVVAEELEKLRFTEDVQITDLSKQYHCISLHGPKAWELIYGADESKSDGSEPDDFSRITMPDAMDIKSLSINHRFDTAGVPGLHFHIALDDVVQFWETLCQSDNTKHPNIRPIGWMAYNIARIEAGTPLFHVDFGSDSLPHETGLLKSICSFTKGCYRGQEIVARMESLGHPAKILRAFHVDCDLLPECGAPLFDSSDPGANTIGAVTSSTISPKLSGISIGFAVVKWNHHKTGTTLFALTNQGKTAVTICDMGQ